MIYEEKIHEKKALFRNNSNLCKDVWDSGNAGAVTVSESGRYIPTKSGEKYMHRRFNTYSDAFAILNDFIREGIVAPEAIHNKID